MSRKQSIVVQQSRNSRRMGSVDFIQLDRVVAQVYISVCDMINESDLQIELDAKITDGSEKVRNLENIISYLLSQQSRNERNVHDCIECANYEKQLQKLESDVRQHIRLQQQLKLYQDNVEEKNEEIVKQKKVLEKQIQTYRKRLEQNYNLQQRYNKLDRENNDLRQQLKILKQSINNNKIQENSKQEITEKSKIKQIKEPMIRTIHFSTNTSTTTNLNHHKDNKQNIQIRKSLDKRLETPVDKHNLPHRQSIVNKSSNLIKGPSRRKSQDKSINIKKPTMTTLNNSKDQHR